MLRFDEVRLQGLAQLQQCLLHTLICTHGENLQEGFGQVHLRVLQRAAAKVGPVFSEAGFVQAIVAGELLVDDVQRGVQRGLHQVFTHLAPVMCTGEDDEGVGVEVLAPVQRFALGVDAVEPAAVFGVVEVLLQRAEQGGRTLGCARLPDAAAEQVQLTRAGHGPVALHRQWLVLGVQCLVGQGHVGVPARALPQRHDAFGEVLVEAGQFGQGGAGVGHFGARRCRAGRHGSRTGVVGSLCRR
ncbi:hypothetical protein D3C78_388470 [compost metagenome]